MSTHPHHTALAPYRILFDEPEQAIEVLSRPDEPDPLLSLNQGETDILLAREEREARKLAATATKDAWVELAKKKVMALAFDGHAVSGNDVWNVMPKAPNGNGRVMSEVFGALVREGKLVPVGWTKSTRGHGSSIRLYEAV